MHNVWTLVQREYLERVRSRSFIIFTVLMPALMAGSVLIPAKLAEMNSGGERHITIVANNAPLAVAVGKELANAKPTTGIEGEEDFGKPVLYSIQVDTDTGDTERDRLRQQVSERPDYRLPLAHRRCFGRSQNCVQHQGGRGLRPVD